MMRAWQVDVIGAAGVAALAAIAFHTVARPHLRAAEGFAATLARAEDAEAEQAQRLGERDSLRMELAVAASELERREVTLRPFSELNRRLAEITELAGEVGVRLDDLRTGEPRTKGAVTRVGLDVAGAGAYPATARFMHELSSRSRDTHVIGVRLWYEPENSGGAGVGRFTMRVEWIASAEP